MRQATSVPAARRATSWRGWWAACWGWAPTRRRRCSSQWATPSSLPLALQAWAWMRCCAAASSPLRSPADSSHRPPTTPRWPLRSRLRRRRAPSQALPGRLPRGPSSARSWTSTFSTAAQRSVVPPASGCCRWCPSRSGTRRSWPSSLRSRRPSARCLATPMSSRRTWPAAVCLSCTLSVMPPRVRSSWPASWGRCRAAQRSAGQ
mmetsp:Transcript_40076/g.113525  ORF Transcript_40076/g.113525 Transcript_40076/m.113525 type:complete len:205 (+) Transcript_40076:1819-2433(+)